MEVVRAQNAARAGIFPTAAPGFTPTGNMRNVQDVGNGRGRKRCPVRGAKYLPRNDCGSFLRERSLFELVVFPAGESVCDRFEWRLEEIRDGVHDPELALIALRHEKKETRKNEKDFFHSSSSAVSKNELFGSSSRIWDAIDLR